MKSLTILTVLLFLIAYPLLSLPYVDHMTINAQGSVVEVKIINVSDLPDGLRDVASVFGHKCMIVLLQDHATNTNTTAITEVADIGKIAIVVDTVSEWFVDWHLWNFFNKSYDYVVVGNIDNPTSMDGIAECLLQSEYGNIIYAISAASFFVLPIVAFLLLYKMGGFKLWKILFVLSLYSLGIMELNYLSNAHNVSVQIVQELFGLSFFGLLPLTVYIAWMESRDNVFKKIKNIYNSIISVIASIFEGDEK